jgi:hypothetical protein
VLISPSGRRCARDNSRPFAREAEENLLPEGSVLHAFAPSHAHRRPKVDGYRGTRATKRIPCKGES